MKSKLHANRCHNGLCLHPGARGLRVACALTLLALYSSVALAGAPGPEPDEPAAALPVMSTTPPRETPDVSAPRPVLDPSARLLDGDAASEAWTLYIELESGHRITQRFLITNAGPGKHTAVAIGHLVEPGRAPYRYKNGRRRARWTLSEDGLFFDIAASHLDLHRPYGELRITKDDIEIRLFFDFAAQDLSARIPASRLPGDYQVEVLAVGAATRGSIRAPWMTEPLETRGVTWLVHSWSQTDEAKLLRRRVEIFARDERTSFYGIQLTGRGDWESAWSLLADENRQIIEPTINVPAGWVEGAYRPDSQNYPTPSGFAIHGDPKLGSITLGSDWLRFDPLEVIPQPFRWFIRRMSKPQEVWADAQIGVTLLSTPVPPSLPTTGKTTNVQTKEALRSKRETEDETAERSVTGVASITFLNPMKRR